MRQPGGVLAAFLINNTIDVPDINTIDVPDLKPATSPFDPEAGAAAA